ncbi:ABC transporter permease [Paenibacillus selenitireducens]|uniref:ABC transporter permease n=1 Tax=Paenibacillus selenitireducens TaxID=1324314 RepID=A0A1T2X630_9BACL|nr:ABC transporter permease [Paenibacillus selenitireducens]OPA75255.1 ABC transporter permease [Paenibacillus selenitireducens]
MLFKLSMSGLKSKLKDYIVLLAGLVMSISIFYMFETLAMNRTFIEANSMIGPIQFVFHAGSVLLAIVTFFYILYANSFLLSLRQNEFGMYMMLGAKKHKITFLMFIETIMLGIISMVLGVAVGIGLAEGIGRLLMKELEFPSDGYHAFYVPSLVVTCIFFFVLFFISAIMNILKLLRVTILQLIHADVQTDRITIKGKRTVVMAFFSILLLLIGYAAMINMAVLQHFGVIIALITITSGTYLLFMSFFPLIIHKMKKNKKRTEKGINAFTFAQLNFRINSLTKVLATVAMLIALAAGAITAGMAFKNNVHIMVDGFNIYDVGIHNPTAEEKRILEPITFIEKHEYRYKVDEKFVYYLKEDLMKNPPLVQTGKAREDFGQTKNVSEDLPVGAESAGGKNEAKDMIKLPAEWAEAMNTIEPYYVHPKLRIKIVDQKMYDQLQGKEGLVWIGKSDDFMKYTKVWKQIDELQLKKYTDLKAERMNSKYTNYVGFNSISSGTVYMGFFLGIAFLAMMASCLMFKILTGASKDIKRYEMLRKIGVRRELLTKSMYKELFMVFLFPAILGIIHVLIGMKMFSFILVNPYYRVWLPIMLFVVIYAIYYFITVQLYRGIVLPKEK